MIEFVDLIDLVSERLGGAVVFANDRGAIVSRETL